MDVSLGLISRLVKTKSVQRALAPIASQVSIHSNVLRNVEDFIFDFAMLQIYSGKILLRFKCVSQDLSAGQKALTSLPMLFSINLYLPS